MASKFSGFGALRTWSGGTGVGRRMPLNEPSRLLAHKALATWRRSVGFVCAVGGGHQMIGARQMGG